MLSKIKPLYVLIAGPAVMTIISVVCYFVLVRPQYNADKEGSLAQLTEEAQGFEDRANERADWQKKLDTATEQLRTAQLDYLAMAKTKTLPMNIHQVPEYTIRLWFLHLEDFPELTRDLLSEAAKESSCEVFPRELTLGPPPMPPPPQPGPGGFLAMGAYTLTVTGTLENIWNFARRLPNFRNCVVRLDSLGLTLPQADSGDGTLVATLPIQMWMLVEKAGPVHAGAVGAVAGMGGGDDEDEEEEEEEEEEDEEDEEDEEEEEEEED